MERDLYNYLCKTCAFAPNGSPECPLVPGVNNPVFDHFNGIISDADSVYGNANKLCSNVSSSNNGNAACDYSDEPDDAYELEP